MTQYGPLIIDAAPENRAPVCWQHNPQFPRSMSTNIASPCCFAVGLGVICAPCIAIGLIVTGAELINHSDCTGVNIKFAGTGAVVMGVTCLLFTCAALLCRPVEDPDDYYTQDGSPVTIIAFGVAIVCEAFIALPFYFVTDDWSCRFGYIVVYRILCVAVLFAMIVVGVCTAVYYFRTKTPQPFSGTVV